MLKNLSIKHKIIGCTLLVILVLIIILVIYFSVKPKTTTLQAPKFEGFQNIEHWDINAIPWIIGTQYAYSLTKGTETSKSIYTEMKKAGTEKESDPKIYIGHIPDGYELKIFRKKETTPTLEEIIYPSSKPAPPTSIIDIEKTGRKYTSSQLNKNLLPNPDGSVSYIDVDNPSTITELPPNLPTSTDRKYCVYLNDYYAGSGCASSFNRFASWKWPPNNTDGTSECNTTPDAAMGESLAKAGLNIKINFVGYSTGNPAWTSIKTVDTNTNMDIARTGYIYTITDADNDKRYLYQNTIGSDRFAMGLLPSNIDEKQYQFIIKENVINGIKRFMFITRYPRNWTGPVSAIRACMQGGDTNKMGIAPKLFNPSDSNFSWNLTTIRPADPPKPINDGQNYIYLTRTPQQITQNTTISPTTELSVQGGCGKLIADAKYYLSAKSVYRTNYVLPVSSSNSIVTYNLLETNPANYILTSGSGTDKKNMSHWSGISSDPRLSTKLNILWKGFDSTVGKHYYQIYYNATKNTQGVIDTVSTNSVRDNNTFFYFQGDSGNTVVSVGSVNGQNFLSPTAYTLKVSPQYPSGTNTIDDSRTFWYIETLNNKFVIASYSFSNPQGSATWGICRQYGGYNKDGITYLDDVTMTNYGFIKNTNLNKPWEGIKVNYYILSPDYVVQYGLLWDISPTISLEPLYKPTLTGWNIPTTI